MSMLAGEITSVEAWRLLQQDPRAVLVDVRTEPEWRYVGVPDLSSLQRDLVRVEWQTYPTGQRNPRFVDDVAARGVGPEQPLLFICRSGARSRAAAELMSAHGFTHCYNVSDGFEGPLDPQGHRGTVSGWRHAGLPWTQE